MERASAFEVATAVRSPTTATTELCDVVVRHSLSTVMRPSISSLQGHRDVHSL